MIPGFAAAFQGAKANAVPAPVVANLFKAQTYNGTGSGISQAINNGLDLSANNALLWIRERNNAASWFVADTVNGRAKSTKFDSAAAAVTSPSSTDLVSFDASGFTVGASNQVGLNNVLAGGSGSYMSWAFVKHPRLVDIVTYTGNATNRTIAHSLGVAPGMILVKSLSSGEYWHVWHRSLTSSAYRLWLNTTDGEASAPTAWNSTAPTTTEFSLGTATGTNGSGLSFVAYLFAHDAATDGIIQCGTFTTDGSGNATVTGLPFQPQFLLMKKSSGAEGWSLFDTTRGWQSGNDAYLAPQSSSVESSANYGAPTSDGFTVTGYSASGTYIYMAIKA